MVNVSPFKGMGDDVSVPSSLFILPLLLLLLQIHSAIAKAIGVYTSIYEYSDS